MALTAQFVEGPLSADQLNTSSIPVVSSTADIIAPFEGQWVFNTTDNMLYRYSGIAWVGALATGPGTDTDATLHEARYEQRASGQSVATSNDTKMKFEAIGNACDDVTASGTNNTDFLLNRGGLWRISCGVRYLTNAGGGERHIFLQSGTVFLTAARFVMQSIVNVGSAPVSVACSTEIRFPPGTTIICGLWQNSGGSITVDTGFGSINHIALTWLRP